MTTTKQYVPNKCDVCHKQDEEQLRNIDLNKQGEVRGLLCDHCYLALSYLNADVNLVLNMVTYLQVFNIKGD